MARSSPSPPTIGRVSSASLLFLYLHWGGPFALAPAGAAHPSPRRPRREVVEDRHLDCLRRGRGLAVIAVEADEDVAGVWLRWVINRPARRRPSQAVGRGTHREAERHVTWHFLLRGGQDLRVAVEGVATGARVVIRSLAGRLAGRVGDGDGVVEDPPQVRAAHHEKHQDGEQEGSLDERLPLPG